MRKSVIATIVAVGLGCASLVQAAPQTAQQAATQKVYIERLKVRAADGDVEAMSTVGTLFLREKVLDGQNHDAEGVTWLEKAAAKGDGSAMYELGRFYGAGAMGRPIDDRKAFEWHYRGSTAAEPKAGQPSLTGVDIAYRTTLLLIASKTAGLAKPLNLLQLSHCYYNGLGVERDPVKGFEALRKAADLKSAHAITELARAHAAGKGTPKDPAKARKLLEGIVGNTTYLKSDWVRAADVLLDESLWPADVETALKWYNKAGDASGYRLGKLYAEGRFVPRNDAEAVKWYLKGAEWGDQLAMVEVSRMYIAKRGKGSPDTWLEKVAKDAKNGPAMVELAKLYAKGEDRPRDVDKAMDWLKKAYVAHQPYDIAAVFAADGDYEQAVDVLKVSADRGDIRAMNDLAAAYQEGKGVKKDPAEAALWKRRAASGYYDLITPDT